MQVQVHTDHNIEGHLTDQNSVRHNATRRSSWDDRFNNGLGTGTRAARAGKCDRKSSSQWRRGSID